MRRIQIAAMSALAVLSLTHTALAVTEIKNYTPVTDQVLINAASDPNNWLMWRRTYNSWAYSPLAQINTKNVHRLQLAWAWTTTPGYQELAPLVWNGIMFLANQGNVVQALDATTGDLIWEYRRELPEFTGSYHNLQTQRQRNSIALYDDKVYLTTVDAHILALDARTGKIVWDTQVADWKGGYSYTGGPLIVKGKVIAGMSGCSMPGTPGGCFITAHDAKTGKELWRTYTIARPGDPNDKTWNGLPVENRFGGSAWITGSYDPELDLIYWGTAIPVPYPEVVRGTGDGAALYTNSVLALDPDTGKMVWYYQFLPRDNWDFDHPYEMVLVDQTIDGKPVKALLHVAKTGIVYALDRTNGKLLWTKETVYQNAVSKIDPETGQVQINEKLVLQFGQKYFVCPSLLGGKDWQAVAYSPNTNALYIPLSNACMEIEARPADPRPGEGYGSTRQTFKLSPDSNGNLGRVEAVDARTGKTLWKYEQRAMWSGSMLTTGGGLLFSGDANRRLRAFDAQTGKILWEVALNAPISGFPMTYTVNGKQYLAVPTGPNLMAGSLRSLTPEIQVPPGGNMLWVFALPED